MYLRDEATQGPPIGSAHGEGNIQECASSHEHLWFYTNIAIGIIVGFWGVCGFLILKSSWRHAYFQFLRQNRRPSLHYNYNQHGQTAKELQDLVLP
jgi:hypothetical protein